MKPEETIAVKISKEHYKKLQEFKIKPGVPIKRQMEDLLVKK